MNNREFGFIDILNILVQWRRFILVNFLVVCLIAGGISCLLPKWYRAKTTILPPSEEGGGLGLSALLSNLPVSGFGIGTGALSEETNLFLAILNSRTVMESVVVKFDLQKFYKAKNMELAVKALRKHVSIEINEDGTITIGAEAKTPYLANDDEVLKTKLLARDMAKCLLDELDKVNRQIKGEKARNTRIFIEKRYLRNLEDLKVAEEAFKLFQQKYEAISISDQTKAVIAAAAELKARIVAKEIEADIMHKYVDPSHSDFLKLKTELESLKEKYREIQYGEKSGANNAEGAGETSRDIFIPIEEVPDIGLQYARLFRELTLQEKILEFLLPQYEQAKIQEAKDTPTVQVLDPAVIPEIKSRPKRAIIAAVAGLLAIFFSCIYVFLVERLRLLEKADGQKYENLIQIWTSIKSDFRLFRNR